MSRLQLKQLTSELEPSFWSVVGKDYYDYYFFIYDWLLQRDRTKIFLALKADAIAGIIVVYNGSIAQLRGSKQAVGFLLENLPSKSMDVQAPQNCEQLLTAKYPDAQLKAHVTLMVLNKGMEQFNIKVNPQHLGSEDAGEIAELMHASFSKMWGEISAQDIRSRMEAKEAVWLGIKEDGNLVSFGYATLTSKVCHVTWVATSPQHKNRGYATSVVSALVKECLGVAESAMIYVMDDNQIAKGLYSKVGFKPYKAYFFIKN
ncbi:MAG: GNAT family N-acetyltransferase [Candidatus Bathyarchaeia archaeon]|jgi:predicted GNAT family acetyltransferase